ncbi:hypothetical protein BD626DRAFT_617095 [Schizophyllum amplum]|uniref:Uncharacterized protein n=1 Tax=Schizophyllum amplum TaxID=97359 RepID=A0A550BWR1_9AGAR|nr:hypothetical protein BD626DRAFT_617095 [Auriculariopsis ampla]
MLGEIMPVGGIWGSCCLCAGEAKSVPTLVPYLPVFVVARPRTWAPVGGTHVRGPTKGGMGARHLSKSMPLHRAITSRQHAREEGGGTYVVREGDSASSSDSAPVAEESSLAVDESSLIAEESSLIADVSSLAVDVLAAAAAINTLLVGPSEFRVGIGVLGCVTGTVKARPASEGVVIVVVVVNTPLAGAGVVGDEGGGVAGEAGGEDEDEATGGGVDEPTDGEGVGEPTDGEGEGEPTDGEGVGEPTDGEGEGDGGGGVDGDAGSAEPAMTGLGAGVV